MGNSAENETATKARPATSAASVEPVAVVGMASRLPGADDLGAFWNVLLRGEDTVGDDIPAHLCGVDWSEVRAALGDPAASRLGGFLRGIDEFDAGFFGVSPREAIRMSPVHRILLETVWDALEDGGIPADSIAGTRTAVYTSCLLNSEYWDLLVDNGIHDIHALLGSVMHGAASGRIAYTFDLRGVNMAVDATCAGSLLAVHLACHSIRSGESETAIVGSVNLQLDSLHTVALARGRVISASGACRFGDRSADGYVRSDGALAVVLKPLSRALLDGDRIYATILGGGTSSAGRGSSLVAPRGVEQLTAIRAAQTQAGVTPGEIDYVEAHGTGTVEGDRTELAALGDLMRGARGADDPCFVGSAKSNVGHAEAASGLVGLVKTALSLWHRTMPRTLHVRTPNEVFAEPDMPLRLVDTPRPWVARHRRRLAGVSSFGMSGTNVHLVLGEAPARSLSRSEDTAGCLLLPVSAREPRALAELAGAYARRLTDGKGDERDVCYSAGARRSHHDHRVAVVGPDPAALVDRLTRFAEGQPSTPGVVTGPRVRDTPRVAFVFPGQGNQWAGMGRELLATNEVFARALAECDVAVLDECGWSLVDRIAGGEPLSDNESQTILWAVQVGLAAVWQDWGVRPDVVLGHSMGEIAAATVTGALSVRDAAAVVCRRGALLAELVGSGAMLAVALGEPEVRELIGELADRVAVAVVNSPHLTVLSGDPAALLDLAAPLSERGVYCQTLRVGFASHSPQMEPLRGRLLTALADLRPRQAEVPMHSTVLEREVTGVELDAEYWMANLRQPVRFGPSVEALLAAGRRTVFVEISPHPTLVSALEDLLAEARNTGCVIGSLDRRSPPMMSMATGLATAYVHGCRLNWERVNPGGDYVPLPGYPWQRARYWADRTTAPSTARVRTLVSSLPAMPTPLAAQPLVAASIGAGPLTAVPLGRTPLVAVPAQDAAARFVSILAELLAIPVTEVDMSARLVALGLDSLLALSLRDRIRKELGVGLAVEDLLGGATLAEMAATILARQTNTL
ncbi:MAG TPA: acyltransferase domain-containing protein [Pseudonocardiaceae bacterium]|jgi:acyl transferase domain-containing protein